MYKKILINRTAVITGATRGLGKEIAIKFVKEGANVILCGRDEEKLIDIKKRLIKIKNQHQIILTKVVDVSSERNIQELVKFIFENFKTCEVLINNAGIYGPKGKFEEIDIKEWIKAIDVNLIGSALLCYYLIPFLKKQNYGKIIQLSGGGATKPMPNISGYAASKAAVVRLAETLAVENKQYNIDVNSVAPGSLNTNMLEEILMSGPTKVGEEYFKKSLKQKKDGGESFEKALALIVFLASSESDGITGKLISAIWDNWEIWPAHRQELIDNDLYTLRRIIGRDRKMDWGDK